MYSIRQMHISLHRNYRKTQQAGNHCVLSTPVHNLSKCHRTAKHSHYFYFLKITFKPTISIRQIFEVLKQPLGPQGSVSWGIVRSRNVRVPIETHSRDFSITILIN